MYWHINDYKVCKHKYAIGENSNEKIMAGYLWNNGTKSWKEIADRKLSISGNCCEIYAK